MTNKAQIFLLTLNTTLKAAFFVQIPEDLRLLCL